jgi:hypothetical protein
MCKDESSRRPSVSGESVEGVRQSLSVSAGCYM